jgi:hypothetical protein
MVLRTSLIERSVSHSRNGSSSTGWLHSARAAHGICSPSITPGLIFVRGVRVVRDAVNRRSRSPVVLGSGFISVCMVVLCSVEPLLRSAIIRVVEKSRSLALDSIISTHRIGRPVRGIIIHIWGVLIHTELGVGLIALDRKGSSSYCANSGMQGAG